MGKTKSKKKFSGAAIRDNPTNLQLLTEDDIENESEDVWERISAQLQSGTFDEPKYRTST